MIVAIPMCAAIASPATSQTPPSDVFNNQVQVGDVFSSGTLNVVTVEEGVEASYEATGNAVNVYADQTDMSVTSNQTMVGSAIAQTTVNVTDNLGEDSAFSTTALGNTSSVGINQGTVTGVLTQISTFAPEITARTQIEGDAAEAGSLNALTTAMGNNQDVALTNGSAGLRIGQTNGADVTADGGAVMQYVSGTAAITGVAVGNNTTFTGEQNSAARLIVSQDNQGALVQASKFTAYGNAQEAITTTTAAGNALNATTQGPLLDVTSWQSNDAYVRSQAEGSSYLFGAAQVSAYGAGNSVVAGVTGEEVVLDNTQMNGVGGVEVIASFQGEEGYDGYVQAVGIGNDVTGYACSDCGGVMGVTNNQTNNSDVSARADVGVNGSARSVTGVGRAVGNNASFYVTRPGQ